MNTSPPNGQRQNTGMGNQNQRQSRNPSAVRQNTARNANSQNRQTAYQQKQNAGYRSKAYPYSVKRMQKRRRGAVSGFAAVLIVMIFVSMSLLIVRSVNWKDVFSDKTRQPFSNPDNLVYGPYLTEAERDAYLTQYVTVSANDVYRGPCILVNLDTPYRFTEEDPTGTDYEDLYSIYKNKTNSYKVSGGSLFLHMDAINALNDWMDAFYKQSENRNIMVNTAYRTLKMQQEIYDGFVESYGVDYANAYAQLPGYSEHHSGYAIDLAVYDEGEADVEGDEAMWKFNGQDEYFWAAQNCTQYGYILRYSASKEDVTGIAYESWHYRYVGIGNALTIQNMGLSLEEYINFIKDYSYTDTKYYITAANGDTYCIYYVSSDGTDAQKIPVPKLAKEYQISGNNIDGFIVSAKVGVGNGSDSE